MIVNRIHLRGFDRIRDFGGQLAQPICATLQGTQSLQLRILLRRHKVAAGAAVTRDGDGLALSGFFVGGTERAWPSAIRTGFACVIDLIGNGALRSCDQAPD